MKMTFKILLISISVFLISCDKFTDVEYYGTNNSDKVLVVKLYTNNKSDSIVYELNPSDAEKQMSVRAGASAGTKHFNCCPCFYNYIKVEVKDKSKAVTKDASEKTSWTFKIKKGVFTKSGDKIQCFINIEQSDLQ